MVVKQPQEVSTLTMLLVLSLLVVGVESWCFDTQVAQFSSASEIDFSIDNQTFLSVDSSNSLINFWRVDTKVLIYSYPTPSQPKSAKFSKDGVNIGIGMQNGDIRILNASNYAVFNTISNPLSGSVVELDFSWNSNSLLACSSSKLMFMNYAGSVSWTISGGGISNMYSCKLNKADGAGFSYNDRMAWYQYNTNTVIASEQRGGGDDYRQVDFSLESPTGMRLMGGNKDDDAYYIISGDNSNNGRKFIRGSDEMLTVCQSKDGKYVASGDKDGFMYIINATNRNDSTFSIYNQGVSSLTHCRFSYDNKYLAASSGSNGNIFFYTTECFPNYCRQGYYNNNGICASCSTITSCLTCSSSTTCTSCIQGFYLSGTSCITCASAGCQACESSSKCLECSQGYYLDYTTNACVRCTMPGCIACERNSTLATVFCRQCNSEYYLNGTDSVCIPCTANNTKCMRCANSSACLECQMGYYVDSLFQCQACTGNCLVCTNSSQCLVCSKGYYSSSGSSNTCVACGTNCLDCYNSGSCSNCAKGSFLNGASCNSCIPPCMTCNTTTYCHSCLLGYYYNGGGSCLACSTRCLTCNSSTYCTSCEIGSYVTASNTCTFCYLTYPNCTTCNIYTCLSCQVGYYPTASGCQICTSISGCNTCSSSSNCTQCNIGYYVSAGSCSACPSQCEDCSDATTCTSCSLGYYLSGTSCLACVSPCVTCTSNTNCLDCQTSYYLDTATSPNACIKCSLAIIGCLSCASSSICNECELGRYVTAGGGCSICPLNCSTCNSTTCLSCSIGFYPTSGYCSKCQQNCSECASLTNCSSCNVGYYLVSASNTCSVCPALGCETCNANGCLSCQIGYLLSAARACLNCNSSFANCQVCSESACTQCLYGFYINAGACSLCYSNLMGCAACSSSSSCIQCEPGYYLQANSTCAYCPSKCRTCNAAATCTSCQLQYTYNAGQTDCLRCESFIDGCQYCTSSTTCETCFQGFYLSTPTTCSFCKVNLIGCVSCSNSTSCSVCQDEYYLLNGACVTCQLIPSCNYCLNSTVCLSCRSGYYLNSNNTCSICTATLPGCIFCASSSTCRQCQAGYFLNAANQCQQCLNSLVGCLSCLNSTRCIECDGGYYLNTATFQCVGCNVIGCQICGDTSPSVCNSCSYGYYLSGTTCNSCPQTGCLDCTSAAVCLECEAGYFLSGTSCARCENTITACSKCLNSTVCSQCDSTFYLNSTLQCSSCALTLPSCVICFNSAYCTTCSTGYYSNSGVCTSCSSITGCFMCQSSSVCQNCVKGYYLSGTSCTSCSSSLSNCFECTNSTICISCNSGYLLNASNTCQQITAGTSPAPEPIPQLQVKTFYVSSQALKHILYAKLGTSFTKQSLTWNSVTTISLYNSATMTTISLTITNVQWGSSLTSIIFYTNNPLNLKADTFSMPLARLLVTSQDFSLSYQTKFSLTKAALQLLMPDVIFSNDFTQQAPLMKPSFYTSYIKNSGQYYFTVFGYIIVAVLFGNFLLKASCTYPNSKDLGQVVPHILALKTCALVVYPIFPQIANFCYGLMGADIPWLASSYGDYVAISSDVSPAGFQLFYQNMNFASLYLVAFIAFLLLLFLGYLSISKTPKRSQEEVFSLSHTTDNNQSSYSYIRMIYLYFSFGLTLAGSASIQGSLYNPVDYYSINGAFYMLGGIMYCVQLGVVIATRSEGRSCYLRSFLKASFLSVAHISPIYICTLAVVIDLSIILYQFCKCRENFNFPKAWLTKNLLANLSLLCLFYYNEKKIALLAVVSILFLIIAIELMEHLHGKNAQTTAKRVKPAAQSSYRNEKQQDQKYDTIANFAGDFKLQNDKEANLIDPKGFNESKTTFKSSAGFSTEFIFDQGDDFIAKEKTRTSIKPEKRNRPFRNTNGRNSALKIQPINQDDLDGAFNIE